MYFVADDVLLFKSTYWKAAECFCNNYHFNGTGTFYNTYTQTGLDGTDLKWKKINNLPLTETRQSSRNNDRVSDNTFPERFIFVSSSFFVPVVCFSATSVNFAMLLPWRAVGKITTRDEPGSREFSENTRVKRNVTSEGGGETLSAASSMCFVFVVILKCDTWGTNSIQTKYFCILRFFS